MTIPDLEKRVAILERNLAQLAGKINHQPAIDNAWIDEIHGTFKNDANYRTAAALGRKWRKSQPTSMKKSRSK